MTRQGLPTATTPAGKSRVTMLPAPTTVLAPMATPGPTMERPPSQTPSSIETGKVYSTPERRTWVFLTKTAKSQFVSNNSDLSPAPRRPTAAASKRLTNSWRAAARICCLSRTLSFSGLPPTRSRARVAFNPASVRLRMTLRSNSGFCSSPQNADMRNPRLCGVVNGIRAERSTSAENQTDPLPGFDTN